MSIFRKIKKLFVRIDDGFLPEKPKSSDYKVGASPIEYEIRVFDGNHEDFLPEDELQRRNGVETMSCVSYSANNLAEIQINWMINLRKISVNTMNFLLDNDYIVNDKVNFSDRFLAIMSNTTPRGNYLTTVAQTLRKYGAIPEAHLPFGNPKNWEEYHDKSVIDRDMLKLGEKFLKYFNVQYEWVVAPSSGGTPESKRNTIHKHLRHTPLQFAKDGHASDFFDSTENIRFMQYDSYSPFIKERNWEYDPPYVMKIVITEKAEFTDEQIKNARARVLKIIPNQHKDIRGNKSWKFFRADANGEAYWINPDGTFKYKTAKGTGFDQMIIDKEIIPISEKEWSNFRPAEIK